MPGSKGTFSQKRFTPISERRNERAALRRDLPSPPCSTLVGKTLAQSNIPLTPSSCPLLLLCPYPVQLVPGCGCLHGSRHSDNLLAVERQGSSGNQRGCAAQLPGTRAQPGWGVQKLSRVEICYSPCVMGHTVPAALDTQALAWVLQYVTEVPARTLVLEIGPRAYCGTHWHLESLILG